MRREEIKSKKVVVKLPEDYNLPDTFKRDSGSSGVNVAVGAVFGGGVQCQPLDGFEKVFPSHEEL